MSFSTLGLSDAIVRAVTARGYTAPTPIQTEAIPAVLQGHDLLAAAQTGTGKTAGFTLPILQRLSQPADSSAPKSPSQRLPIRALILTPTRELAAQVEDSVREYGKYLPLRSVVLFGGVNIQPQIQRLKSRVDILVATPGRLLDHVQQGTVDLSQVEILVLDEADRMLDMGFLPSIRRVLALLPKQKQTLLFSATFSNEIKSLAGGILNQPVLIEGVQRNATAELVDQKVYWVDRDKKSDLLAHLIKQHRWFQVLVFTRTKHGADRLSKKLSQSGISSLAIHGNKTQAARTRTLAKFKEGTLQVLVATDIAARGIDINELPQVVNFELPYVAEDYVHRIGRTGRAGSFGEAISLVCIDEHRLLADIEKLIDRSLPQETVTGFEPDLTVKPEPLRQGNQRQPRTERRSAPSSAKPVAQKRERSIPAESRSGKANQTAKPAKAKPTKAKPAKLNRSSSSAQRRQAT